jgi:hypothetical protein
MEIVTSQMYSADDVATALDVLDFIVPAQLRSEFGYYAAGRHPAPEIIVSAGGVRVRADAATVWAFEATVAVHAEADRRRIAAEAAVRASDKWLDRELQKLVATLEPQAQTRRASNPSKPLEAA